MRTPNHIALILDGNRRFARHLMAKPWKGHELGKEKVKKLLEWCSELGIREVTLYTWSIENFNRPMEEFNYIMKMFREAIDESLHDGLVHDRMIRIRFLGRLGLFPSDLQESMRQLMEATENYDKHIVNFCMAYGGRQEIADAARKIVADLQQGKIMPEDVNEEMFKSYLYMADEPDMIIRTGGEKRLSGFLLYQCNYSELFFVDKMWPEFEKSDLVKCIDEFRQRERRFGR